MREVSNHDETIFTVEISGLTLSNSTLTYPGFAG
jgi:hypothetical protein